ncbi:hypothetical protein GCM10009836_13550 [Pseudonocardia ailaonensis]|uniref:Uncharacterized protein n=1 Tax=Pseudonocardia ailaonensis TaxID=367279 RepID=A0ABN2MT06_9PSEU
MIDRFEGWIAGLGTAAGTRVVVGRWPRSPLGAFTDVMVQRPDGHRLLLAPSPAVAEFVEATYSFDEVAIGPVGYVVRGDRRQVTAGPLECAFRIGGRAPLGWLLRGVPGPLATDPRWVTALDGVARRVLPGVRTVGTAGQGRREFYCARDLHRIVSAVVRWQGADQGGLTRVDPPVTFGFGSTPAAPSLVRITTLVER